MLTNDGVLPLHVADLQSIAVIGPHADDQRLLQGDYHYPAHLEIMLYRSTWTGIAGAGRQHRRAGELGARVDLDMLPTDGGSFHPGPHFTRHVTPLTGSQRGVRCHEAPRCRTSGGVTTPIQQTEISRRR